MSIWNAEPHTRVKVAILERYLETWISIVGRSFTNSDIFYIDGFAGPGKYSAGEDGSPITALKSASRAIAIAEQKNEWKASGVKCVFVERSRDTVEILRSYVDSVNCHRRVTHQILCSEFDRALPVIRQNHPSAFGNAPLFAFLDPFGLKGLSWSTVEAILRAPSSEVLLLFDADGVTRSISALDKGYNASSIATLDSAFGDNSWRSAVVSLGASSVDFDASTRNFVRLYKERLMTIVPWVYSFQMITPSKKASSEVGYHLVFATAHRTGLIKMKEAMKQQGQGGQFVFANARSGPQRMLNFNDPSLAAQLVYEKFKGQRRVPLRTVDAFILTDTEYNGPAQPLKVLEQRGLIEVEAIGPNRRRNTYPSDKVRSITFSEESVRW